MRKIIHMLSRFININNKEKFENNNLSSLMENTVNEQTLSMFYIIGTVIFLVWFILMITIVPRIWNNYIRGVLPVGEAKWYSIILLWFVIIMVI